MKKATAKAQKSIIPHQKTLSPVNQLPIDTKEGLTSEECPHFYNRATTKQRQYAKDLIKMRLVREKIEVSDFMNPIAEICNYNLHGGKAGGNLLSKLHTLLSASSFIDCHFREIEKKDILKFLKSIAFYFTHLEERYEGMFFDYLAADFKFDLPFYELLNIQERHLERKIIVDEVWPFDLAFETPFKALSEASKIERLRLYLSELEGWQGNADDILLPEHVSKYLKKAIELNKNEGSPLIANPTDQPKTK